MDTTAEHGISSVRLQLPEVAHTWELIAPMLQTVVEQTGGEYSLEDIYLRALAGTVAIWVVYDGPKIWAVAVAEIAEYPGLRAYRVLALAGREFERWKHLEPMIEDHARQLKCDVVEALCRPGMAKKIIPQGYVPQCTILRKKVERRTH